MRSTTGNPVLRAGALERAARTAGSGVMTLQGTIAKSALLVLLTAASAGYTWWHYTRADARGLPGVVIGGMLAAFVVAIVTTFKPQISPWTGPLYAVLEGLALGGISLIYQTRYAGLPMQAVGLTIATLAGMLVLYRLGVIRATERFRSVIVTATLGIMIFYLISIGLSFFGVGVPMISSATPLGIGFSVVVSALAALNLILDFDMIEQGVRERAPKFVEWYASFGLLVTLVWLYLELLRLLSKLQRR